MRNQSVSVALEYRIGKKKRVGKHGRDGMSRRIDRRRHVPGEEQRRPRFGPLQKPRAGPGARASLGVADVFPSRPSAGSGGSRSLRIASTVPVPRKRPPSPSPGWTDFVQKKRCGLMAS